MDKNMIIKYQRALPQRWTASEHEFGLARMATYIIYIRYLNKNDEGTRTPKIPKVPAWHELCASTPDNTHYHEDKVSKRSIQWLRWKCFHKKKKSISKED